MRGHSAEKLVDIFMCMTHHQETQLYVWLSCQHAMFIAQTSLRTPSSSKRAKKGKQYLFLFSLAVLSNCRYSASGH